MLVPVARPQLPAAIRVAGPGPTEPPRDGAKPTPAIPAGEDEPDGDAASAEHDDGEGEGEEDSIAGHAAAAGPMSDPYANLEGAFGGYAADQPKPQTDNLLF